mmetsp:Transcript_25903/g.39202  ORF Transcript_25903/g.39202 Transcript_25903/m.39202 type:complete len:285 (-) Transcript_25903:1839-2693(-)|eukprot:CAMPEP_0178934024 /NCGR_PEP_ID=MMETSP0786-20121207/23635_1 /TAXON_ID=186022 /ORGANISM="Thalassionema frauenfeldii, Strain CCMP 1798" /LENGTH=284 /DNA_ID=CAMNT_0020611765 /DNA_START=189 /DNA_END=1043 /DNA_ORIENTATION=-
MINFNSLKERVKAQAEAAKEAARSIRNFDEMAAKDDYIHHERLRTPDSKPINPAVPKQNVLLQATQFSMIEQDEENNIGQHVDTSDRSVCNNAFSVEDDASGIEMKGKRKKKDPKRFMEDLSERLARPDEKVFEGDDQVNTEDATESIKGTDSTENQQKPKWDNLLKSLVVDNVLSKLNLKNKSEEARPILLGPLSRRTMQEGDKDIGDNSMEHDIIVSSSVLGLEEQEELERIKMSTGGSGIMPLAEKYLNQNSQFVFIIFTLLLGSAVYFYSRHHEEIDDVT